MFDWNIGGNLQVISTYFTTRCYWADQQLQGRPTGRGSRKSSWCGRLPKLRMFSLGHQKSRQTTYCYKASVTCVSDYTQCCFILKPEGADAEEWENWGERVFGKQDIGTDTVRCSVICLVSCPISGYKLGS